MYTFVKIKNQFGNGFQWFFHPNSVDEIIEHFTVFFGREVKRGVQEKISGIHKHPATPWGATVEAMKGVENKLLGKNKSWLDVANSLENQTLSDRIKYFTQGRDLFLSAGLSYMISNENSDVQNRIEKEIKTEELKFPEDKFSIKNVRYISWPGGKHIYAKIGHWDVVDKYGNQKWSTKTEAMKAAKWFVKEQNKNR